jgi:hypothetical protein
VIIWTRSLEHCRFMVTDRNGHNQVIEEAVARRTMSL